MSSPCTSLCQYSDARSAVMCTNTLFEVHCNKINVNALPDIRKLDGRTIDPLTSSTTAHVINYTSTLSDEPFDTSAQFPIPASIFNLVASLRRAHSTPLQTIEQF